MTGIHLWVSPAVLDWDTYVESWKVCSPASVRRAYEHLEHAEKLLARATGEFDLVDVVTTLKRSVDHRLRLLNEQYRWKSLPLRSLPQQGHLQLLESLGIAKPRMVTRLIAFRNSIEHGDKLPPDKEQCADLLEVVWYFLRSTDLLGLRIVSTFSFMKDPVPASSWGIELGMEPETGWSINFRASLPKVYIHSDPHDAWLRVNVTWSTDSREYLPNLPSLSEAELLRLVQEAEHPIFFNGMIDGRQDLLHRIFKAYFAVP